MKRPESGLMRVTLVLYVCMQQNTEPTVLIVRESNRITNRIRSRIESNRIRNLIADGVYLIDRAWGVGRMNNERG